MSYDQFNAGLPQMPQIFQRNIYEEYCYSILKKLSTDLLNIYVEYLVINKLWNYLGNLWQGVLLEVCPYPVRTSLPPFSYCH